ncbi:MAG: prenyltransferase/squalene oxidase repeat-containing protein [Planctomycetota bacterium]|jgi:hypothetical protein
MSFYTESGLDESIHVEPEQFDNSEDLNATASIPWVGIAMAFHCLLVAVAWFIVPTISNAEGSDTLVASANHMTTPPEPVMEAEDKFEMPEHNVEREPSEDIQIAPDPTDIRNEDPTEQPNEDLAENENNDPAESAHPSKNSNSSIGHAGNAGGGKGGGGKGGFDYRRSPPPGGGPPIGHTDAALQWLADHQNTAGHWSATTFSDDSKRRNAKRTYNVEFVNVGDADGDKGWEQTTDVGLTGLALLAFAGGGYDQSLGKFRETVRRGVLYLRRSQDQEGCFGAREDDHFIYNHAICTMAMAELYGLSAARVMRPTVQRATDFILRAQNPGAGWRYGIRPGQNDVSVTGWMILALKSCKMAGIEFDSNRVYEPATEYLDLMTVEVNGYPKTGYKTRGSDSARLRGSVDFDQSPSMESIHIMCDLFSNKESIRSPQMKELANICAEKEFLPKWEAKRINYYYWYYASLALHQMGGSSWDRWEAAMSKTLIDNQRGFKKGESHETKTSLDEHGSWDAVGAWCPAGGRVYSTAINCLTLQVWYRYQRVETEE